MAVCKHCGTEIEEGLDYCPNCGQSINEMDADFFQPDEGLEEGAYNIFDAPEEFDMESFLNQEFSQVGIAEEWNDSTEATAVTESDIPKATTTNAVEEVSLEDFFGLSEQSIEEIEDLSLNTVGASDELVDFGFSEATENDFVELDDLFQNLDEEPEQENPQEEILLDDGLKELLAADEERERKAKEKKKEKKQKKEKQEKKSFFQTVFGNVPVDPSKKKKELTPEQIAEKKQREAEEKKAKAEEKKLASEEKKQVAKRNKEEKARIKYLKREERKAKKLEEAKQILEEMRETRINRLGATIVFVFFIVCGVVLFSGSDLFSYAVSVNHAEKDFNKALKSNNVMYYTDAYNEIYGLEIKPEDQVLNDKIMTVMFVNKHLNSYNSYMRMKKYDAALHSLLMGLYRYGELHDTSIPLGIDRDMDFVRTQILKSLENSFNVTEDEAELLRALLEKTGVGGMEISIDEDAARAYNLALYEILKESGLEE